MATVREVIDALETRFPPHLAEDWDVNGLTVGDLNGEVSTVLFAVDPTLAVADEALAAGAQLLVTHHPLMLRGVTTVAAHTAIGAVVHRLVAGGCALYNAHTNADVAAEGVADALANALGLTGVAPLVPRADNPAVGAGRVGRLAQPVTLEEFATTVANTVPSTAHGVQIAGDMDATVESIAVMGGAGDSYLDQAFAAEVDVYVTADLRHHPASSARELASLTTGRPYLVDVSHFASEWLWLARAAEFVADATSVNTMVSDLNTDPWTARIDADT